MQKSEMRMRQSDKKMLAFEYEFSFKGATTSVLSIHLQALKAQKGSSSAFHTKANSHWDYKSISSSTIGKNLTASGLLTRINLREGQDFKKVHQNCSHRFLN